MLKKVNKNPIVCHKIYVITCTFSQKLNEIQDKDLKHADRGAEEFRQKITVKIKAQSVAVG